MACISTALCKRPLARDLRILCFSCMRNHIASRSLKALLRVPLASWSFPRQQTSRSIVLSFYLFYPSSLSTSVDLTVDPVRPYEKRTDLELSTCMQNLVVVHHKLKFVPSTALLKVTIIVRKLPAAKSISQPLCLFGSFSQDPKLEQHRHSIDRQVNFF